MGLQHVISARETTGVASFVVGCEVVCLILIRKMSTACCNSTVAVAAR